MQYLGHVVSTEGVKVDETKIQAVMHWPIPSSMRQLRAFLGLASYYHKFIHHFVVLAAPLTDLLKKDNFKWSTTATEAFRKLQQALAQAPVLALPDFSQPFVLEIDALGSGIGAILSQQGHPQEAFFKSSTTIDLCQRDAGHSDSHYQISSLLIEVKIHNKD